MDLLDSVHYRDDWKIERKSQLQSRLCRVNYKQVYDILTCFSKCTISFRNSMIFCYELHLSSIYRALGVALCVLTFTSDADCIPDLNYVHLRQNSGRNTNFKCTVSLYFPCLLTRKSILRKNDRSLGQCTDTTKFGSSRRVCCAIFHQNPLYIKENIK